MLKLKLKPFLSILVLIFAIVHNLCSQDLIFHHLTSEDGLSQNSANTIIQDNKGFIWIGTQDGLNKFDGYNFTIINQDPVKKNKLTGSHITTLYQDKNNLIWIGTWSSGLNIYDPVLDKFYHFQYEEKVQQTIQNNRITSIIGDNQSKENVLWIGTNGGGLSKLWYKNESQYYFEHFQHDPNSPNSVTNNNITSLLQGKNGALWIGTDGGGLNYYHPQANTFKEYSIENNGNKITRISCLYNHIDQTIWIGSNGSGLIRLNPDSKQYKVFSHDDNNPYSLSDNKVLSINNLRENSKNYLLIGTEGFGLNVFDSDKNKFTIYKQDTDDENGISHNKINCIAVENGGGIWLGTDYGLDIHDSHAYDFHNYKHIPGNKNSLSNEFIWSIYESRDGMLWIATDNGLNRLDRKNKEYKHWFHDPKNPKSISYNEIMDIYEDKNGFLWIGTWHEGLNKFDRKRNTFKHIKHDPNNTNSISDNNIRLIYEDPIGNGNIIWLGTKEGGLVKFNINTEEAINYIHNPDDVKSISDNSILSIFRDSKNALWIGTWGGGLNKFDEKNQQFTRYKYDSKNGESTSHTTASIIYEDQAGNFWIGTHGVGLCKFDRAKEVFEYFTSKDGLPNDVIYGILEDEDGNLWISTNKGISRFNPNLAGKSAFKNYDASDGLLSDEFNNGAFFKSKNGEFFFGGVNGFNSFFPKNIKENKYLPPVVFTDFKIFNKTVDVNPDSILKKNISYLNHITLDYNQTVFTIEFSALNYTHPEKNQYKYRLIGFDKNWTFTNSNRRFATYTNLEPGEYEFSVKAANNDGYWNEVDSSIKITILPPFWLTWWFRFAIFAIIAGGILAGHTRRMNKVEQQNIKLEAEVSRRTKELEKQKNELQIALNHVNQLSGLLPICASCKKIRDDKGYWNQIETYIMQHSEADFSHGICPDCYKELYPELANNKLNRK